MKIYNQINKCIDDKRSYTINFAKRLIQVPTVNPPGKNYKEIVDILEKELKKMCFSTRRVLTPKALLKKYNVDKGSPRINLIADWNTGSKKTLHINGHYDVVPAVGTWKYPPFKGVLKNGRLYGRGSEDMKGTIAAIFSAVSALKVLGIVPKVNIQLSFTPDEELGGMTGFGWLVKHGRIKADYGLSEGYTGQNISCGNKGMLWVRIDCLGKASHASAPHRGVNSFNGMLKMANAFDGLNTKLKKRKTKIKMEKNMFPFSSMVMGGELEGGNKVNIIPQETSFSIDRRLIPEEDFDAARKEIKNIFENCARKNRDYKFKMKILAQDRAVAVDVDEEICKVIESAVKKVLKKNARFLLMAGATDLRYLIKKGIASVGYSARGGESWHSENEFVYAKSILDAAKVYALTILGLKG